MFSIIRHIPSELHLLSPTKETFRCMVDFIPGNLQSQHYRAIII